MKTLSSVEAQNRFGELLDAAQREPVTVTRRGRPVAFVVSPQDMQELMDARRQRSKAVVEFEAFFKKANAHSTPAAHKLTQADINKAVGEKQRSAGQNSLLQPSSRKARSRKP